MRKTTCLQYLLFNLDCVNMAPAPSDCMSGKKERNAWGQFSNETIIFSLKEKAKAWFLNNLFQLLFPPLSIETKFIYSKQTKYFH